MQLECTHETVDFRVLLEREIERERCEEDDGLDIVKVRDPVLALFARGRVSAARCREGGRRRTQLRDPPTS